MADRHGDYCVMAIYHCSLKNFSRAEGHSAVAAAAYRAGALIRDERTRRIHRYEKRRGVKSTFILAPNSAPKNLLTRACLWNAAETRETRKNSRVAREVILALPYELSDAQRAELTRDMALWLIERYRVVVDIAIHSPVAEEGHDPRNHHAHLLFTTREVGSDGLGAKTRILDDKVTGPQEIELIREVWETLANDALGRAGFGDIQIDRRSLEEQGVDRIPQTHEGKASKNAKSHESVLAKAFRKAGERSSDDTEGKEGEGKKGSSGSSSGGGGKSVKLPSKQREDAVGRKIDYPTLDKKQTRSNFVKEIKALNEKRAAFGDKPIKEQIAQLDRLMERLDKRLDNLQTIKSKTTLPSMIKSAIANTVKLATNLLTSRKESQTALRLSAQERQQRKERQLSRYGRTYREGLHSQIKEMKRNISILEQKQTQFRHYKSFVDKISSDIKPHTAPTATVQPKKATTPKRQITNSEAGIKLHLKAEMIKSALPKEITAKTTGQKLTSSTAVNNLLQTKGEPIRIDKTALKAPEVKIEVKLDKPLKENAPPAKAAFNKAVKAQPTPEKQNEYKQKMPVKIKAMEKELARHKIAEPKAPPAPEDRKSWFTPASKETQKLQDVISKKIKEMRQATPKPEPQPKTTTKTQTSFEKTQERPVKTATNEAIKEKIRAEAEAKRANIPPEFRAKPYEQRTEETPKPAEEPKTEAKSAFSSASSAQNTEAPSKPTMSNQFNMKSGFNDAANNQTDAAPEDEPEIEI